MTENVFVERHPGNPWSSEKIGLLKKYWVEDRLTAPEIAKILGISRNGIIGKAHRMGFPKRMRPQAVPRRRTLSKTMVRLAKPKMASRPKRIAKPFIPSNVVVPISFRLCVMELDNKTCRFPSHLREPLNYQGREFVGFSFCGHKTFGDEVYCRAHCMVAYKPVERRAA